MNWRCTHCGAEFKENYRYCPVCGYTVYEPIKVAKLREWCETNLDTSTFDGMYAAKERVEAEAERLNIKVRVRWDNVLSYPPGFAGTHPNLAIDVCDLLA